MAIRKTDGPLAWQSKTILLLVLPWTAGFVLLQTRWWVTQVPVVAYETLGISALFGLIVWRLRAATPGAALTGTLITASIMYGTASYPYKQSWLHGGLLPLLAVFLVTYIATKIGRAKKEKIGAGENKSGRNAAQVAANLGVAALTATPIFVFATNGHLQKSLEAITAFIVMVPLAEAAADTVSSELGQVYGGEPRMITTLRRVTKGTDGGITLRGTLAGIVASLLIMVVGFAATYGTSTLTAKWISICIGAAGGVFGLLFDSLLGATLERKKLLNNDAVNFLSTLSAVLFTSLFIGALAYFVGHHGS